MKKTDLAYVAGLIDTGRLLITAMDFSKQNFSLNIIKNAITVIKVRMNLLFKKCNLC